MTIGMAFAGVMTLDFDRAWGATVETYSSLGKTISSYSRSKRLAVESDFASGLNLFLGYPNQVRVFAAIGRLYQARSNPGEAVEFFEQGIAISEMLRSTLRSEEERIAFQAVRNDLYDRIITVLMETGKVRDALNYAERARSRAFLDALAGGEIELQTEEQRTIYASVSEQKAEASVVLANVHMSDDQVDLVESKTRGISKQLKSSGSSNRNNLIHITEVVEPDLSSVSKELESGQAILAYYISNSDVYAWLVTRDGIEGKRLDIRSDEVRNRVQALLDDTRSKKDSLHGEVLYEKLVAPFVKDFSPERLFVVPHGVLHAMPFVSLKKSSGSYLVHDYAISYTPSIAIWQLLKSRSKGSQKRSVLLVGEPEAGGEWPELVYAEQEIREVASLYGERATVLTGMDASRQEVRKLSPSHDILHIISHGYFDQEQPLESGLVLAGGEDGILRAGEIFSFDLSEKLVVLSACETARSSIVKGDEMMGLLRSFFFAGAEDVVASLWMVDDESTATLMSLFHKHLKQNLPGEALRLAQLDLAENEAFANPYYWAAFGVYGTE